ncbi:MAG: hypothetical protein ABFC96_09345 [Thermoguttaceae bacterium]
MHLWQRFCFSQHTVTWQQDFGRQVRTRRHRLWQQLFGVQVDAQLFGWQVTGAQAFGAQAAGAQAFGAHGAQAFGAHGAQAAGAHGFGQQVFAQQVRALRQ